MATKQCKHCRSEIDEKASKCPHCQSDLRSWFQKHPILTIILALFIIPTFLSGLFRNSEKTNNQTTEYKKESINSTIQITKSPLQVEKTLSDKLNLANKDLGFFFYKEIKVDEQGWATFTVSDDWYNLESYIQERLVKIAVGYYKEAEGGLNDLAEVSLEDGFGKEVATGYYSSGGIKVEISK
jgi:hypothetical protein